MKRRFRSAFRSSLLVGITIVAMAWSAPVAAEAYWLGLRGDDWNDGIENGLSNWYDEPSLAGQPQKVPRDTAIFAGGAINFTPTVRTFTKIGRIRIEVNAPLYTFIVDKRTFLHLVGPGIVNQSNTTQLLSVSKEAGVTFHGKARIVGTGAVRSLGVQNRGSLLFLEKAKGGDAVITNDGGTVAFNDESSADQTSITNQNRARLSFFNKSKADGARIINAKGIVLIQLDKDETISILSLNNSGELEVRNPILIRESIEQSAKGVMHFKVVDKIPSVRVNGTAKIDGELIVSADKKVKPGAYKIIVADVREGMFKNLQFEAPGKLGARLSYPGNDVVLTVEAK